MALISTQLILERDPATRTTRVGERSPAGAEVPPASFLCRKNVETRVVLVSIVSYNSLMNRCMECGLDMDMVGIRHRCVSRVSPEVSPKLMARGVLGRRRGRPRIGEVRDRPWEGLGMSRATWYRRRKEPAGFPSGDAGANPFEA